MKVRELRALIYSQYDSAGQLAAVLGWPQVKLSRISCGSKEPDVNELNELAAGLHRQAGELAEIFLRVKSPNRQQCNGGEPTLPPRDPDKLIRGRRR